MLIQTLRSTCMYRQNLQLEILRQAGLKRTGSQRSLLARSTCSRQISLLQIQIQFQLASQQLEARFLRSSCVLCLDLRSSRAYVARIQLVHVVESTVLYMYVCTRQAYICSYQLESTGVAEMLAGWGLGAQVRPRTGGTTQKGTLATLFGELGGCASS